MAHILGILEACDFIKDDQNVGTKQRWIKQVYTTKLTIEDDAIGYCKPSLTTFTPFSARVKKECIQEFMSKHSGHNLNPEGWNPGASILGWIYLTDKQYKNFDDRTRSRFKKRIGNYYVDTGNNQKATIGLTLELLRTFLWVARKIRIIPFFSKLKPLPTRPPSNKRIMTEWHYPWYIGYLPDVERKSKSFGKMREEL